MVEIPSNFIGDFKVGDNLVYTLAFYARFVTIMVTAA